MPGNNKAAIKERRENLFGLLAKGMKGYQIARALNVDPGTVSRDTTYLVAQSQNYLNDLARETLPFMYQTSIEGIREILKECWNIYQSNDPKVNMFHKVAALRLAKECQEAIFHLVDEGPSVLLVKNLQEKLINLENIKGT